MADQDDALVVTPHLPAVVQGTFNLDECDISSDVIALISKEVAKRHKIIPISRQDSIIHIATADPNNVFAMEDVRFLIALTVEAVSTSLDQIKRALVKYYSDEENHEARRWATDELNSSEEDNFVVCEPYGDNPDLFTDSTVDAPVVRLVNMILVDAVKRGATTIHLETYTNDFRVRYRLDGQMQEIMCPPLRLRDAIISRIKVMANFNMKGRGLPQKGVIKMTLGKERRVDFSVHTLPTAQGEKMVIHVLDNSVNAGLTLEKLGFQDEQFEYLTKALRQSSGLVLVVGPSGSGRHTTLYKMVEFLNSVDKNIFTAEEVVRRELRGVNQILLRPETGWDLKTALDSFKSQDIDVLMVGETPWDKESVVALIKTALSGRLVLSPFQAEDSVSAISSLLDLGVSPFLLASSLTLVCSQRLARKICNQCARLQKQGCQYCNGTGYAGLVGFFEVLPLSDSIRKDILSGAPASKLRETAQGLVVTPLAKAGFAKALAGLTTNEEIARVTPET